MTTLLLLLPFAFLNLFHSSDFKTDIKIPQTQSKMEIAQDANFSSQTLNFSAGQTIYVRVTADNNGNSKSVLNLHDNSYNLLKTYQLSKINTNPYQFTTKFPAPSSGGNYSLEARVESDSSVVSLVQTIEIEGSGSDQSKESEVNVKIENKVNTNSQVMGENEQPTSSPSVLDKPGLSSYSEPGSEGSDIGFFASVWTKIIGFFKGIF